MSSDRVSEKRINEIINNLAGTGHVSWLAGADDALRELLQRRKDGGSPEEFVERMAEQVRSVRPEARAGFLQALGAIQRHVTMVREFMTQAASGMGPTEEKMARHG